MSVGTPGAIRQPPAGTGAFGQGVSYPLAYDPNTGRLALSSGTKCATEALQSIFQTQPGERPMQPDYGAASVLFEPVDMDRLLIRVREVIADHEARVDSIDSVTSSVGPTSGEAIITVTCTLIGDATPRVLTFPYFTGPA